jgi:hypothetical protein
MEGQKRATSAIDRKTLERADTIAINNQVEYNLRIRKKRKKKRVYSLKSSRPFFLYGRSLEHRELHEYDVHGGGNTKK